MDIKISAQQILQYVGGARNVNSLVHCATRLRFVLLDESLIDEANISEIDVVKGTFSTNGQYQVIIGAGTVNRICDEIHALLGHQEGGQPSQIPKQKGHYVQRSVKFLSDIFVPIIPAIVAGGLMMGLFNVLSAPFFNGQSLIEMYPEFKGLATMINSFANAPFIFLPVLIGFSATKSFGGNPYLGAAMAMIMVHPDLLNAYSLGTGVEIPTWNIFGLSIDAVGYQGSVLPVLAVSFLLSTMEKKLRSITPSWLDNLTTPLLSILITAFLTFVFVGPMLRIVGDLLADGIVWVYTSLGVIGGALFGGLYAPIVLTGMHHSFIAVETQLIAAQATTGGSFIFVTAAMSNVAQGAAVLAVLFITKNEKMKSLCSASGISALLGITEPAMFGVNLKLRYPFMAACIGSACGSAWIALCQVFAVSLGAAGLPGFISIEPKHWLNFAIGLFISIVVTFSLTFVFAKREANKTNKQEMDENAVSSVSQEDKIEEVVILNPLAGEVNPICDASDEAFSSKAMGEGVVIRPSDGKVYAPEDATIAFVFPSKHAIGLTTKRGISLLIHCGIDTVNLNGRGYHVYVQEQQAVKRGDLLLDFDLAYIEQEGLSTQTPVVITNLPKDVKVIVESGKKQYGDAIMKMIKDPQ